MINLTPQDFAGALTSRLQIVHPNSTCTYEGSTADRFVGCANMKAWHSYRFVIKGVLFWGSFTTEDVPHLNYESAAELVDAWLERYKARLIQLGIEIDERSILP